MSKRGNPMTVKNCTCTKCGAEAHTVPGTQHRRCSGNSENNTLRDKRDKLEGANRGKWE